MFNPEQVLLYQTFGYVVMREVFSAGEIETMRREFDKAMERVADFVPTPGESTYAHSNLLGDATPFFASLTEDERLYGPARQVMGEDTMMWEWKGYRYCQFKGTPWHANNGDPTYGRHLYGARCQWPIFEQVTADTGALRVIPGSHLPGFQWQLGRAHAAGLLDPIADVGAVVCEAELGDVVTFDTRLYHSTAPHDTERRAASSIYLHFPQTREETAVTAQVIPQDGEEWDHWPANKPDSPFRQQWEEQVKRLHEMYKS